MDVAAIDWIPAGTKFAASDMVHVHRSDVEFEAVLADIDLIVTGPHATASFPGEMQPFVDPALTRRLQYDFSDWTTSPVARRWAELDPHVLYIEDPHPRAVRDANRPRPTDLLASLRDAFDRLRGAPGERPSLAGVDAVRPVTFGYLPVLVAPDDEDGWSRLGQALEVAGALGIDEYERVRDDVVERVIEAKLRRLADLDPSRLTVAEWNTATHLDVLSIHDTMNHTARPDGAICVERQPADRLPNVVALSNRGDARAEVLADDDTGLRDPVMVPTMDPARVRSIGAAYRQVFDAWGPDDVGYNRPYLGGHETQVAGPYLRDLAPRAVVRPVGQPPRALQFGAWQNEFCREFLLGEDAASRMMQPGDDWVVVPDAQVDWLADKLKAAHDLVRAWGTTLDLA